MEKEKKPIYKKWWFWLIAMVLIIAFAGVGTDNQEQPVISQGGQNENVSKNETKEMKVNVGETIQTSDLKISYISSEEYNQYDSYSKPQEGNKVIRVEFGFENISNGDVYLESFECYADDSKCKEYYFADDYKTSTLESLSKGKKTNAIIYYEVPISAEKITLEYETNLWTNEKIEFIVK